LLLDRCCRVSAHRSPGKASLDYRLPESDSDSPDPRRCRPGSKAAPMLKAGWAHWWLKAEPATSPRPRSALRVPDAFPAIRTPGYRYAETGATPVPRLTRKQRLRAKAGPCPSAAHHLPANSPDCARAGRRMCRDERGLPYRPERESVAPARLAAQVEAPQERASPPGEPPSPVLQKELPPQAPSRTFRKSGEFPDSLCRNVDNAPCTVPLHHNDIAASLLRPVVS
jgi:hypothetical protein